MLNKPAILLLLFGFLSGSAVSQEIMLINLQKKCIASGGIMDEELYRFDDNNKVGEWVDDILNRTGEQRNFQLIQTNVENVSAVLDGDTRYLFYSIDFIQKATAVQVYGALAHEIGHHANNHIFTDGNRLLEESEADAFMGYFFSKKNLSKQQLQEYLESMPSSYGDSFQNRYRSALVGFEKAERSLKIEALYFDNDPKAQEILLPAFTIQPCFTTCEIPSEKFNGAKSLGKVEERIRLVLDQRGYYNRSYFSVKNGFAVVTQMEQYNSQDGTIRNDRTRWLDYPARDNFEGIMDYFKSVVVPNKGYFRIFVFVVTSSEFKASGDKVSKSQAAAWLGQGANRLPKAISSIPFTDDFSVSALVYEFEVPKSNGNAKQICPAPTFDARTHLIKSGLGRGFDF